MKLETKLNTSIENKYLVQWNISGYYSNVEEIKVVINETHFKHSTILPRIQNFTIYTANSVLNNSWGGVLTAVKNNIQQEEIDLPQLSFEAVAVKVNFPIILTICNVYISPNLPFNLIELNQLISHLPKPFILLGDFNAHAEIWGSETDSPRGKAILDLIDKYNLNIFNTCEPTHLS